MGIKSVSIIGCGWLGQIVGEKLSAAGYDVQGSTTRADRLAELENYGIRPVLFRATPDEVTGDAGDFFESDGYVLCLPPTRSERAEIDYPAMIRQILNRLPLQKNPRVIFTGSSAVYGNESAPVSEESIPAPSKKTGRAILKAEKLVRDRFPSAVILRLAGLVGINRHPGRFLMHKKNGGDPHRPVNLLHGEDAARSIILALEDETMHGIYNVCSRKHPTREEFYTLAARLLDLEPPLFSETPGHSDERSGKIVLSEKIREHKMEFLCDDPLLMLKTPGLF